jgi:hypothetical protein
MCAQTIPAPIALNIYQKAHFTTYFLYRQTQLVSSCSGKTGVDSIFCFRSFLEHAHFPTYASQHHRSVHGHFSQTFSMPHPFQALPCISAATRHTCRVMVSVWRRVFVMPCAMDSDCTHRLKQCKGDALQSSKLRHTCFAHAILTCACLVADVTVMPFTNSLHHFTPRAYGLRHGRRHAWSKTYDYSWMFK